MRIHDTLSGSDAGVGTSGRVRIYLCGVTVYDESHVGHARTIVVFDVLRRYLEDRGADVELVQNFTDVDDKIIARAEAEGVEPGEISARYIEGYFRDFDGLNVRRAAAYPRATDHIGDIIRFIEGLLERGAAYAARNGVYFSVSGFQGYGKLSKKDTGELRSGARVSIDGSKRDPLDFALWKFAGTGPVWDSPWGAGRPGWHIECSAMSTKYLGENFDVHGGGRDLIFPHHENEIAQSESFTGAPCARAWMHVGMVTINGEKMSKSLGNVRSVRRVMADWGPNVVRLFCLSGHHSKPIDYSEEMLGESLARWRQAEACFHELDQAGGGPGGGPAAEIAGRCAAEFDSALENGFNTHLALSSLFVLARETNRLAAEGKLGAGGAGAAGREFGRMLGILGLAVPELAGGQKEEIAGLVADRERLRREGKFAEADRVRARLNGMNVELIDHGGRTTWVKREEIGAGGPGARGWPGPASRA